MEEKYLLAVNLVSNVIDKKHPMYPFFVCAFYGLFCKYKEHEDLIISLLSRTDIIFDNGPIDKILEKHGIEQDFVDPVHDENNSSISTHGVSNQGHSFVCDDNGKISYLKNEPFVICSTSNTNMGRLLNTFCHEMGHLIKGEENSYYSYQDNDAEVHVIRTGLAHHAYSFFNGNTELSYSVIYSTLDEAVNCIQTTDVMREIISLKEFVNDEVITSFIDSLDHDDLLKDHGYEDICLLVRKLWEHDSFKKMIEENIVLGDIDSIIDEYDGLMGEGSFDEMSGRLDQIYALPEDVSDDVFNSHIDSFVEITNQYQAKIREKIK